MDPQHTIIDSQLGSFTLQKAFIQYLQSLAQSGILELPAANDQMQSQVAQAVQATDQWLASNGAAPANSADSVAASTASQPHESAQPIASVQRKSQPEEVSSVAQHQSSRQVPGISAAEQLRILEKQVRQCELCPELVANRTQTVFGVGSPKARLCFLGEAPGADEDRQGEPFVGAAGQLLTRIIQACKMTREEVYILNTLKCRPPNNRNPTPEECTRCSPFLDQQLKAIRPEFICCLGGIAAKHLLETELSVGRLRGKWHLYEGIKVMVTYHPAYLLRNPDAKRQVWDDMKFLMNEMGHDYS